MQAEVTQEGIRFRTVDQPIVVEVEIGQETGLRATQAESAEKGVGVRTVDALMSVAERVAVEPVERFGVAGGQHAAAGDC